MTVSRIRARSSTSSGVPDSRSRPWTRRRSRTFAAAVRPAEAAATRKLSTRVAVLTVAMRAVTVSSGADTQSCVKAYLPGPSGVRAVTAVSMRSCPPGTWAITPLTPPSRLS
ncbi:hypothetical protein [Streptomyces capitiformicae]|uniref:Uncharacterized protein n=1 Tax=Streptomyces capitiformicae TaxID=2014920 RepID=A0A919LD41_9ACTN|nr:hypothetical protein [Streptomyces capitiformicae]GHH88931.1 hypothetical protein GCM10017771_36370 [Streptomyces capitiformicae]